MLVYGKYTLKQMSHDDDVFSYILQYYFVLNE